MPDTDLPKHVDVPNPPATASSLAWGLWGLKWLSFLSPERMLMLLFVTAVVMMYYDAREDKKIAREEANEAVQMLRRDIATVDEKNRLDKNALAATILRHCAEQDKINRDEGRVYREKSEIHMKDAMLTLSKMTDSQNKAAESQTKMAEAVNTLSRKVAGMKDLDR